MNTCIHRTYEYGLRKYSYVKLKKEWVMGSFLWNSGNVSALGWCGQIGVSKSRG